MATPDRTFAWRGFAAGAVALGLTVALARGPAPRPAAPPDPAPLARELATLANRGAAGRWMVTYTFVRTRPDGQQLHSTLVDAHRPPLDIQSGLGSVVVTDGARAYSCTLVDDHAQCLSPPAIGGTDQPGAVFGGAVISGHYTIARTGARSIAGIEARCYELRLATGLPIAGLGTQSEQCYSSDGVPLLSRITRAGGTDERTALGVRRTVGRAELAPLLAPYGLSRLLPAS